MSNASTTLPQAQPGDDTNPSTIPPAGGFWRWVPGTGWVETDPDGNPLATTPQE